MRTARLALLAILLAPSIAFAQFDFPPRSSAVTITPSAPLSGGGTGSSLTLSCPTCFTTAGGALTGALTVANVVGAVASGAYSLQLQSGVADGASAVGFISDTGNVLANATAKLVSIRNGTVEKTYFDTNGYMRTPAGGSGRILAPNSSSNYISIDDTNGIFFTYGSSFKISNGPILGSSGVADGATAVASQTQTAVQWSTAGATLMQVQSGSTGILHYGVLSGTAGVLCAEAEELVASGTVTAGQVVVWSGSKAIATAGASANLTTIAGVAITGGAASSTIIVCRRGRVLVSADAGIAAGNLLGTSSGTAGNAAASTPGAGAIVGRATEATGGTVTGKVVIDLILG